jgi:hypothetical protein
VRGARAARPLARGARRAKWDGKMGKSRTQRLSGKLGSGSSLVHERDWLPFRIRGQPPQHLADRTDPHPRLARRRVPLVILALPPVPPPPREAPLGHPPLRQEHEPLRPLGALHDLDSEGDLGMFHPFVEVAVVVLPVGIDHLPTREPRPVQLPQHARRRRPVVGRGRRDHHRAQQTPRSPCLG